jgi:hypothetical protein
MAELLVQAKILGIDPEDVIEFVATQVQTALAYPPNYNFMGDNKRIWVIRGFYPGTPLFFKLSVVHYRGEGDDKKVYAARASGLRVRLMTKNKEFFDHGIDFSGDDLTEALTNRMENSFFNANHDVKALLEKKIRMPRCVSPKGMKLFRFEKPTKRKNVKKSR